MGDLTKAKRNFIHNYIAQDFKNATGAYMKAYPKSTVESAGADAARMLRNASVQQYIGDILAETIRRDKIPLERRILDHWMKRAFYDPLDILDAKGSLKKTQEELQEEGLSVCIDQIYATANGTRVVLADKEEAAGMLTKYLNIIHDTVDVNIRGAIESTYAERVKTVEELQERERELHGN